MKCGRCCGNIFFKYLRKTEVIKTARLTQAEPFTGVLLVVVSIFIFMIYRLQVVVPGLPACVCQF